MIGFNPQSRAFRRRTRKDKENKQKEGQLLKWAKFQKEVETLMVRQTVGPMRGVCLLAVQEKVGKC